MSNGTKWIVGLACLLCIIAVATPIFFYVKDFYELPRSTNPADWGTFGDFFGGILNPILSLLTLIVTIMIAVYLNRIERRNHEETVHTPVKPLFTIETGEFFSSDTSLIGPTVNEDFYDYNPPEAPTRLHNYLQKQFYLKVYNKGLGIANQVNVTFEIDLNALKNVLTIDDPKIKITTTNVMTDEDGSNFIVLNIKADYFNYQCFFYKIWALEKAGLGVIDKIEEVKVLIPSQIMGSFQFFNVIRGLIDKNITFPTTFVTFDYKNIHDKALISKFRIGLFHVHDYGSYSMFRIRQEQIQ